MDFHVSWAPNYLLATYHHFVRWANNQTTLLSLSDLNQTQLPLASDGPTLNLRKFIEFRQRQLNVNPMTAYGVDVVAGIVGNYTCTVTNIHGQKSASLGFQIQS